MEPVIASAVACLVGYLAMCVGLAIHLLATQHYLGDFWVSILYVAVFASFSWMFFVAPTITVLSRLRLFHDLRWSWLGGSLLAMVAYLVLTTPLMGWTAFDALYFPVLQGALAGFVFAWLLRRLRRAPAAAPHDPAGSP